MRLVLNFCVLELLVDIMTIRKIHRYLGFLLMLYLFLLMLTGCFLSFKSNYVKSNYYSSSLEGDYSTAEALTYIFNNYPHPIKSIKLNELNSKLWLIKSKNGYYAYFSPKQLSFYR